MNTICVVIPTYNRCASLARAIDSILQQSHQPTEIIVVDDGSTDATAAMLHSRYPMVRYLVQANRGVSAARNYGIRSARACWIALLDSDDEWLPDKLTRQIERLNRQPDVQICHTEERWNRNGKWVNPMRKHKKYGGWIYQRCLPLCVISPSSILIERDLLLQSGLFDESLPACEDYDLWLRLCAHHPVAFIEQPLIIKYGGHEDQLSKKYAAMDQFRIQSLVKILAQEDLRHDDRKATLTILWQKVNIYLAGARKRGKHQEVIYYQQLLDAYPLEP